jgi:hypothetical protein
MSVIKAKGKNQHSKKNSTQNLFCEVPGTIHMGQFQPGIIENRELKAFSTS